MTAKKLAILSVLAILACAAMLAGPASMAQPRSGATATVTMSDVDSALAKGPVFLEFETAECSYCKQQHPISQQLQGDYAGKVTFFFVDANENRDLAKAFQVTGVPQMDVIATKADGKYTYVDKNGATSDSIGGSRIMGLTQKDTLKKALDAALNVKK